MAHMNVHVNLVLKKSTTNQLANVKMWMNANWPNILVEAILFVTIWKAISNVSAKKDSSAMLALVVNVSYYVHKSERFLFCFMSLAPCEDVQCGQHATCHVNGQEAACICEQGFTFDPSNISAGCIGE